MKDLKDGSATRRRDKRRARPGKPYPLGATWDGMGINFALYSENAASVEVCLFDSPESTKESASIKLPERTASIWHGYVPHLRPGQLYGYRVDGPHEPENGHRFNRNKVLLDPYAKAIGRPIKWDDSLFGYTIGDPREDLSEDTRDSAPYAPLGAVVEERFMWGDDRAPGVPWEDTIIYETHVRGISMKHPDVDPELRGTYLAIASDPIISHLKRLGITTVQLLPVHAKVQDRVLLDKGLRNYWGYNTLNYFAPEPEYATRCGTGAVEDFKMMVRALHAAGLEVIIDVVYNHTGEGNRLGPTLSFRGIDNMGYYKESPENPRYFMDYTGTGNTLDTGNPHVLQLITDSLRYWATHMRVDGFRFDLASVLARDMYDVNMLAAFFQVVQQDPVLSQVKLIAEPWDVGPGGYQVGSFPWQWTEWNGRYRDAVRRYWRGDAGVMGEFASRVSGSSDLYELSGRRPFASINFLTAHDGFTLEDLVSYDQKHNEENGEDNRDGHEPNFSTNCGVEGETDDEAVLDRRETLKRSMMATLLLSQGAPMILGGDELSNTQKGNNNTYCQDNELTWYDWDLDERKEAFLAFVQHAVRLRRNHQNFRRRRFLTGEPYDDNGARDVLWWHPSGREMQPEDWDNPNETAFGMLLRGDCIPGQDVNGDELKDETFLVLFNGSDHAVEFRMAGSEAGTPDHWETISELSGELDDPRDNAGRVTVQAHKTAVFVAVPSRIDTVRDQTPTKSMALT